MALSVRAKRTARPVRRTTRKQSEIPTLSCGSYRFGRGRNRGFVPVRTRLAPFAERLERPVLACDGGERRTVRIPSCNSWVADVLAMRCGCGYSRRELDSGGLMAGVVALFRCADCQDIVSAATGLIDRGELHWVEPLCPGCGATGIEPWGEGEPPAGVCPRCGKSVQTEVVGIAD